jgi:NADH-quinone oxidoreductase subunit M
VGYQRVFHGEPDEENRPFAELQLKEGSVLLPFIGSIVFIGVYPKPMLDRIEPSVERLDRPRRARTDGSPTPPPTLPTPKRGREP